MKKQYDELTEEEYQKKLKEYAGKLHHHKCSLTVILHEISYKLRLMLCAYGFHRICL